MPSGTTVNLKLLIQATNRASRTVESLRDQLNAVSKSATELAKKSGQAGRQGTTAMKQFEKSTAPLRRKLDAVTTSLKGMGNAGLWLIGIATSLSTIAFFPVKSAADFEQQMSRVLAVTAGAKESFEELKNTASELGRTTKFTAKEAAQGMVFLGMAGFEAQEVIEGIGPSLQLAAAAGIELSEAADIATNIISAMRIPVEDLSDAIDVLANTTANSNTNMLQLADAMKYAAPLAAAAGVSLEEVASIMGVLGNNGIQASQAGTAVRGMLRAIAAPTAKAKAVLDELNVTIETQADGSIDLIKVLHDLADAQLTTAQANAIFGRFAAAGALAVTANVKELDDLILSNERAAGAAEKMAKIMKDNVRGQLIKLTSALDGLKRAFGDPLLEPIKALLKVLTSLVSAITKAVEKFPILTKVMGVALGGVIALTAALGGLALALASVSGAALALNKILQIELVASLAILVKTIKSSIGTMLAGKVAMSGLAGVTGALKGAVLGLGNAIKALISLALKYWVGAIIVAVVGLLVALAEWSNRNKRLINENKKLAAEMRGLHKNLVKTEEKVAELTEGTEKYTAAMLNLRQKLLDTAENQKEVAEEAEAAANSINEMTGEIIDQGKALDAYKKKVQEVALDSMVVQITRINEEIKRLNGTSDELGAVWTALTHTWMRLKAVFGPGTLEEVNKEIEEQKKKWEELGDATNKNYLRLLEEMDRFDPSQTPEEVTGLFRAMGKVGFEEAERIGKAHKELQEELDKTKKKAKELEDLSLEDLRTSLDSTSKQVDDLRYAYDEASLSATLALAEWNNLTERQQKSNDKLRQQVVKLNKIRVEAFNNLREAEEDATNKIVKLGAELAKDTKKQYDAKKKAIEKDKDLKVKEEWEANKAIAELNEENARNKLKNLEEVRKRIEEDGLQESELAKKNAKDIEKAQEDIRNAVEKTSDERKKHANEVKDYLISIERDIEKEKIGMLVDEPKKIRQNAELEVKVLKDKAKKVGVEEEALRTRIAQIRKKAEDEADEYIRTQRYETQMLELDLAKDTADRMLDAYDRAFDEGRLNAKDYVAKSLAITTGIIDQEIAILNQRLKELQDKYGPDHPITIPIKIKIEKLKGEKEEEEQTAPVTEEDLRLQNEAKYLQERGTLLQAELDQMTTHKDGLEAIARQEREIQENNQALEINSLKQAKATTGAIEARAAQHTIEQANLTADQERAIMLTRLSWAEQNANDLSSIFGDIYELGGKKNKAWFKAQKAAAIAASIMNTQQAAMKAYAELGPYAGAVAAALIIVKGALAVAKISAQTAAEGGEIRGRSPHKKADNIPVMATAGEWVMPVDTVQTYGRNVMEAMRKKLIPPQLFRGYKVPVPVFAGRGYAEGGEVRAMGDPRQGKQKEVVVAPAPPINITNIIDPTEMDRYLGSSAGQNAILNVLTSRKELARTILK